MTVTSLDARDEYTAVAAQTVFNYTFKIYDSTELDVYITPVGQTADDSADLTTAYTVDVSTIGNPSGGFITLNSGASAGDLVTVVSGMPYNRTVDYQNSGDFLPDTVNGDNDRQVSQIKQVQDLSQRSPRYPNSLQNAVEQKIDLPLPLGFWRDKADGTGIEKVDLTTTGSPTDSSVIAYVPPFTGGVTTDVESKLAQRISVKDFGAIGDGVTNDQVAVQAAIDYAGTVTLGAQVYFPEGEYSVNSLSINYDGVVLVGAGRRTSRITGRTLTLDTIVFGNGTTAYSGCGIRHIGMAQTAGISPTKTAGIHLRVIACTDFMAFDMDIRDWWTGVSFENCARCDLMNVWLAAGGKRTLIANRGVQCIYNSGATIIARSTNIKLTNVDMLKLNGSIVGAYCEHGYYFDDSDSIFMVNCHVNEANNGITVQSKSTGSDFFIGLWASNCYFDLAYNRNLQILGDASTFEDIKFTGCDFRAPQVGQNVFIQTTANVSGVSFVNCDFRSSEVSAFVTDNDKIQQLTIQGCHFKDTNTSGTTGVADANLKAQGLVYTGNQHTGGFADVTNLCVLLTADVTDVACSLNVFSTSTNTTKITDNSVGSGFVSNNVT